MSTELLARIDKNRVYCLTYDYDFRGTEYLPFTLLVLASEHYDPQEYIRDYDAFVEEIAEENMMDE